MPRPSAPPAKRSRVDVREWLGGIRLSGFTVVMLGLVVLAAFVLVPSMGTLVEQQQRISALEHSVEVTSSQIKELERERERWSDPAFIATQARERLFYVRPGEVVYLVEDDLDSALVPQEEAKVSDELTVTRADWMSQFVRSVVGAGSAATAAVPLIVGVPDETPVPTGPAG